MPREITAGQIRAARIIAGVADMIQIALFPLFVEGGFSPFNDALDVVVAGIMVYLLGFHWAFLPTFAAELVPVFDLVPTWSLAVLIATRNGPTNPDGSARAAAPVLTGKVTDVEVNK